MERIRSAIADGRIEVLAQPIVALHSGCVEREELLVRMLDEHGDRVPPSAFLPAAERFGLIQDIDLLVLGQATERARNGVAVAVNVSAISLADARYLSRLEGAIAAGLDPLLLNFEITETAAVANMADARGPPAASASLARPWRLTTSEPAFSSFTHLKELPTQYLKIDIEFVRELIRIPPTRSWSRRSSRSPAASARRPWQRGSRTRTPLRWYESWASTTPRASTSVGPRGRADHRWSRRELVDRLQHPTPELASLLAWPRGRSARRARARGIWKLYLDTRNGSDRKPGQSLHIGHIPRRSGSELLRPSE